MNIITSTLAYQRLFVYAHHRCPSQIFKLSPFYSQLFSLMKIIQYPLNRRIKAMPRLVDTHGQARGTKTVQAALDLNPGAIATEHRQG